MDEEKDKVTGQPMRPIIQRLSKKKVVVTLPRLPGENREAYRKRVRQGKRIRIG